MIASLKDLLKVVDDCHHSEMQGAGIRINVSLGTCGIAAGGIAVRDALKSVLVKTNASGVVLVETGCMGLCHSEPTVEIVTVKTGESFIYGPVKPEQAEAIIASGTTPASDVTLVEKSWYYPEIEANTHHRLQARIVLRNSGCLDPENINDYLSRNGYVAMGRALSESTAQDIINVIDQSGLRGRGGGGFPTGKKWSICAAQKNDTKYIICNADEGDPGAFMDRAVLEGDPHAVLEGMIIGGFAIGAHEGIIYIRAEYPLAIKRLEIALNQARKQGFLGKNILGSGYDFDICIKYGAGAFVCGEETALIASIMGKRGMPNYKPPFPAIAGLWAKPTIVNNVETFANVPAIMRKGAAWFKTIGTAGSPGTKVFSMTGKILRVGLIEVPMGISLKDIIYKLGEGIKDGKKFKAVQTGGPSGGCISEKSIDTPIDYDTLKALGSMIGSGGMIVLDEDDCMVDVAKFFLEFTMEESCGKCTPCRIGGRQLHGLLQKITDGRATLADIDLIRDLAESIKSASMCGLGMTSPNPVLATLNTFEDEYTAHIVDHRCPAGKCAKLITYTINEKCTGCTACARKCPVQCIKGTAKQPHEIIQSDCIRCGSCFDVCKFNAVRKS